MAGSAANGVRAHVGLTPDALVPGMREFENRFLAGVQVRQRPQRLKGYIAAYVLKAATEKAGSFDSKAIAAAMKGLSLTAAEHPGVLLDVKYDDKGDLDRVSFIVRVNGRHQEMIAVLPAAGGGLLAGRRSVTDPVRIAVVGAGLIGYQHILRVRGEPEAALAAIVDPTVKAQELARDLGTRWFPDLHAMLEADRPDGVIVATPNQLHVANGLTCVAAGIPMLMEKPVSDDVATGWELVAATEQAGVPMLVGHHRRHSPLIQQAKEIVASGAIGRVTTVNGLCWFLKPKPYFDAAWRREPGAGVILINLIHVIDDLRNLCGDVESVQALQSNAVRGFPGRGHRGDAAALPQRRAGDDLDFRHRGRTVELGADLGREQGVPAHGRVLLPGGRNRGRDLGAASRAVAPYRRAGLVEPDRGRAPVVPEQDPLVLQLRQFCRVVRREEPPLLGRARGDEDAGGHVGGQGVGGDRQGGRLA